MTQESNTTSPYQEVINLFGAVQKAVEGKDTDDKILALKKELAERVRDFKPRNQLFEKIVDYFEKTVKESIIDIPKPSNYSDHKHPELKKMIETVTGDNVKYSTDTSSGGFDNPDYMLYNEIGKPFDVAPCNKFMGYIAGQEQITDNFINEFVALLFGLENPEHVYHIINMSYRCLVTHEAENCKKVYTLLQSVILHAMTLPEPKKYQYETAIYHNTFHWGERMQAGNEDSITKIWLPMLFIKLIVSCKTMPDGKIDYDFGQYLEDSIVTLVKFKQAGLVDEKGYKVNMHELRNEWTNMFFPRGFLSVELCYKYIQLFMKALQ